MFFFSFLFFSFLLAFWILDSGIGLDWIGLLENTHGLPPLLHSIQREKMVNNELMR